jgi:hypothetical protein
MTVHRFRIYHSTAGASSFQDWFGQFTLNVNAALDEELTREETTLRDPIDDTADSYYSGDFAFAWDEGKENLFQNFDLYAADYCAWHRIGYHECTHDGTGGPCSWDEQRESGPVPAYIEDMSPA